jgi:hypothetical protein
MILAHGGAVGLAIETAVIVLPAVILLLLYLRARGARHGDHEPALGPLPPQANNEREHAQSDGDGTGRHRTQTPSRRTGAYRR